MKESTKTILISFGTSVASIGTVILLLQGKIEAANEKTEQAIAHQAQTDIAVATLQANTSNMVAILQEVKNDVKEIRKDLQRQK